MQSDFRLQLQRPGAREAARNLGWLIGEKAARLVLNVGVGFWVARHLGPARFGALNYALACVGLLALLAELGLDAVVRRELIATPERHAALLATAWGLRLAGGAAAYALLAAGVAVLQPPALDATLMLVLGLTLLQPAWMVGDLAFQARLESRYTVWAQVAALALAAALRIAAILAGGGVVVFAWVAVGEFALTAVALAALLHRRGLGWRLGAFDRALATRLWREAWPLLLSGVAVVVYMRIDAVMLRGMAGEAEVGIYAAATRFTEIWYFVPVALASSLLPSLLRARERGPGAYATRLQACYDLNAAVAYGLAVPIALAAPWLIRTAYGAAYAAAAGVLALHVWSSVFVFLGVARGQFLVNERLGRFYLGATLTGAVVNIALNLWLIPLRGAWGAALATVLAQALSAWASSFASADVRGNAAMQTRALLLPLRWPWLLAGKKP